MIWEVDSPNITVYLNISDSIDKKYNEQISYFNELKNKILSKYDSSLSDGIDKEKTEDIINEEYIQALINYINLYTDNIKNAEANQFCQFQICQFSKNFL